MSNYPETTRYYYHPVKISFMGLVSFVIYWPIVELYRSYTYIVNNDYVVVGIALLGALVVSGWMFSIFVQMLRRKPAMILTHEAVYIHLSRKNILWKDIANIQEGCVVLKHEAFSRVYKNPLNRWYQWLNTKIWGQTFRFPVTFVKGKATDIDEVLYDYHRRATEQAQNS